MTVRPYLPPVGVERTTFVAKPNFVMTTPNARLRRGEFKVVLLAIVANLRGLLRNSWRLITMLASMLPTEWIVTLLAIILGIIERQIHLGRFDGLL